MESYLVADLRPFGAVAVALLAGLLIMATGHRRENLRESWTLVASVAVFGIIASMLPGTLEGKIYECSVLKLTPAVSLHFKADPLGMLFAQLASLLWIVTSFYSIGYMRDEEKEHQTSFFAAFATSIMSAVGISFAGNLVTFILFYETLTISTYPLVAHNRTPESLAAGRKYLAYTLISGQLFLFSIIWAQNLAGTTEFVPGGFIAATGADAGTVGLLFACMFLGASVKAAIMPLHAWLPAAMIAPTPVSALLHAVAVVKAGAFAVIRIVGYVFGPELLSVTGAAEWAVWVAAFTILVSSIIAMRQDNLKRRLAFSTIGQLSYVVLGAVLLTPLTILGAIFHIVAHAFMKITLFFSAGSIYTVTHERDISRMKGIGRQMPVTMLCYTVGAFGVCGIPFVAGFISKWNIAIGAIQGGSFIYAVVLLASGLLSVAYLVPVSYMGFFKVNPAYPEYREAGKIMLFPIIFTAVFSIVLGILPDFGLHFYDLADMSIRSIFGQF